MKFVKFIPTMAATVVLAACSTATDVVTGATDAVTGAATAVTDTVSNAGSTVANTVTGVTEATTNAVSNTVSSAANSVQTSAQKITTSSKSVVYSCLNKVAVSATYAFEGDQPKAVNLKVGNKSINGLVYDANDTEQVVFKSASYVWNLDNDFRNDLNKGTAMLTQKGKDSDPILAKLCEVNKSATKRLTK